MSDEKKIIKALQKIKKELIAYVNRELFDHMRMWSLEVDQSWNKKQFSSAFDREFTERVHLRLVHLSKKLDNGVFESYGGFYSDFVELIIESDYPGSWVTPGKNGEKISELCIEIKNDIVCFYRKGACLDAMKKNYESRLNSGCFGSVPMSSVLLAGAKA